MSDINETLHQYAARYETADFIKSDPSWFMHQVTGERNQETLAFIASCLSYGSRKQFFPKIQNILDMSHGNVFDWVADGLYKTCIADDNRCFYRLYTNHAMMEFLNALQEMLITHGSIKEYVSSTSNDALSAINSICDFFSKRNIKVIIPKDTKSACKRICLFLRWMVRDNSTVDIGIWKDIIPKHSLIMPLDTHVLNEAVKLNLIKSKTATMTTAIKLTERMAEIFPDDPLKGDFALFGYGVSDDK